MPHWGQIGFKAIAARLARLKAEQCMHACVRTCMHVCVHMCVYVCVRAHVCMRADIEFVMKVAPQNSREGQSVVRV